MTRKLRKIKIMIHKANLMKTKMKIKYMKATNMYLQSS